MRTRAIGTAVVVIALMLLGIGGARVVHGAASVNAPRPCTAVQPLTATVHRAGIVVTFGDGHTDRYCVEFSTDSITGIQLLESSGLHIVTTGAAGLGGAVCAIGADGSTDPTHCFTPCTPTCLYWKYFGFKNGVWAYAASGASRTIHDGDVDGWAWGSGGATTGAVPGQPGVICPTPTALPLDTPTAI